MELRKKVIGVPLQKAARADNGDMLVRGFFTSDQKDEVGDIITRSATERAMPKYRQWGNIRYMHQPRPVGRVSRIGVEDGLGWNEVEFKVIDPQAQFEVEQGLLQALSVGILVDMSKVEMLQDGGWVINDYQLAEISLVDHPANYDAALETLNLSMNESLRSKIREQGLAPVLRSLGDAPAHEGEPMEKELEEKSVEAAVVEQEETPVVETTPVVEEAKDLAADIQQVVEDAATAEEVIAPVVEDTPVAEEAAPVVEETQVDVVAELMNALSPVIAGLVKQVEGLTARFETPAPEVEAESEDAKGIDGEGDRVAQLEKQLSDLKAQLELMTTPVDRKGALPVEEPATVEAESAPEVEKKLSLKEALSKHFEARARH